MLELAFAATSIAFVAFLSYMVHQAHKNTAALYIALLHKNEEHVAGNTLAAALAADSPDEVAALAETRQVQETVQQRPISGLLP